jgi:ubiquitin-conjugating enzyme E2 O
MADSPTTQAQGAAQGAAQETADPAVTMEGMVQDRKQPTMEGQPAQYLMLDSDPPPDHALLDAASHEWKPQQQKRIRKDHAIIASDGSLPEGVYVRSWESRMDLFRVLMIGPVGTPYEHAPFLIDFKLPAKYPQEPPVAHFHSWTYGQGRVNPNLYEDGKICLSLLNT